METVKATEGDLETILRWLECEYQEDGEGFWSNRGVIKRSFSENGDLWVIRENGEAVAFQVGNYGTDIVCVRKDRRRLGYGTTLHEFSLARAYTDDVNVLAGECSPPTSLPFWEKKGFERHGDTNPGSPVYVRRVLDRKYDIPAELPKVEVTIDFYPEAVLYSPDVSPLISHLLTGGLADHGTIMLPYRVIGLNDDYTTNKDLVVKVLVDGDERCFCKAKYDKAKATGVQYDSRGNTFYIDKVEPAEIR